MDQTLVQHAKDYALACGLIYKSSNTQTEAAHIPFTLLPSPFPRNMFNQAMQLQPLFNTLIDKIALDSHFLESIMTEYLHVIIPLTLQL